jgi:4-hydroxy-3-methylbut-2-enyl diphosphate reductase
MGQINSKIYLVENIEDVNSLRFKANTEIAYVTQTTLSLDDTSAIIKAIKLKFVNVIEPRKDDICYATTNRQNAVKKIASFCDIFFVIGAKNSSNSIRLVEVAKQYGCKEAVLLENIENFNQKMIKKDSNIGITASASAPEILVQNFINLLKKNYSVYVSETKYTPENVVFKIPQNLKTIA